MKFSEIDTTLGQTGLQTTYYSWPEKKAPSLPYLVWYLPSSDNFVADDMVYQRIDTLNVELYTKTKDFAQEIAVEAVLDANHLVWNKTEAYLEDEKMYEVLYEMEIIIDASN
jgi:hypothetical protein